MPNISCDGGRDLGVRNYSMPNHGPEGFSLITIIINGVIGLVLLYLINFLSPVHIPINILTVLFAFFTGILGVVILAIAAVVGFI